MKNKITITREQFFDFVKNKSDSDSRISRSTQHYMNYFDHYQATSKKRSWNWVGFLPLWYFYRRMYLAGFSMIGVHRISNKLGDMFSEKMFLGLWGNLIDVCISFGLIAVLMGYADYLYLRHANEKIYKGTLKSGTSLISVILPLAIIFMIFFTLYILGHIKD